MNKILSSVLISFTVAFSACNNTASNNVNAVPVTDSSNKSVEKNAPNSQYKPAFAGQTRIDAIKTQTPFEGKLLTKELKHPWGIVTLPDGRFLITEKEDGTLRIATTTGTLSAPITGLLPVDSKGQGG